MTQQLGRHELLVRLAAGGAANVFLARDTSSKGSGRLLALKVLLPNLSANEDFLRMFFTEARIAAQLQHDNIVQIAGFGRMGGIHSLAMEYVFGASLAQVLRQSARKRKPLTVGVLLKITASVCSALHYAHELRDKAGRPMGLVHRDVTPQNILLGFNGRPKLTDFGIAKAIDRGWETQVGVVKGKFCYMSPEQALGKEVDPRSDIFGAGIVLWEALTGRDLFKGSSPMEVIAAIREQEIERPSQVVEGLSPVVDPIVMKALMRSPRQRYQSAKEMQQSIEALIMKAGVLIDHNTISRELSEIFGDTIPRRALALRHAMLGHENVDDLCEALGAQALNFGHLPTPNSNEADEEDPLGLFASDHEIPVPVDGITPLLPADSEQPLTAKVEGRALHEEFADVTIGSSAGVGDDLSDLSDLDLDGMESEPDSGFASMDEWNDRTEMIEDHDELLELLSEKDLSEGKIPAVFTARFKREDLEEIQEALESEEFITSDHPILIDQDDTAGLVADLSSHVEQRRISGLTGERRPSSGGFGAKPSITSGVETGPEILLGEQVSFDSDTMRPLPRAPSLDMEGKKQATSAASNRQLKTPVFVKPAIIAESATTSPSPQELRAPEITLQPESGAEATFKNVPVLATAAASAATPIIGTRLPRSKTKDPSSGPIMVPPRSSTPPVAFVKTPKNQVPLSAPTLTPLPEVDEVHAKMIRLRLDVLLLLILALILFGIALGLVIAKFIGLPTLT